MLMQPERLANDPPNPIALHGVAGDLGRDGEPQPRARRIVRMGNHPEESVPEASAARIYRLELRLQPQASLRRQREALACGSAARHATCPVME